MVVKDSTEARGEKKLCSEVCSCSDGNEHIARTQKWVQELPQESRDPDRERALLSSSSDWEV